MKANCLKYLIIFCTVITTACEDNCKQIVTYRTIKPFSISWKELRQSVKTLTNAKFEKPGKIYIKDQYIFINEIKKGIHIIDNSNPSSPKFVSFLNIPGNIDMAVVDNILYADSYLDMVALDITNPLAIKEINRVGRVFPFGVADGVSWYINDNEKSIVDYEWITKTDTVEINCEGGVFPQPVYTRGGFYESASFMTKASDSRSPSSAAGTAGIAGSMARFGVSQNHLYAVTQNEMIPFNIENPTQPKILNKINLTWGIETIFPYKDKLFIGSTTGMHIYDNTNPSQPKWLSTYSHFKACDPVVVHDNYAYVTLRANNAFGRCGVVNSNQLDLIDINDPENPKLIKTFPMDEPAGLGIDFPNLFICEGKKGLKLFNAQNPMEIGNNLLAHFKDFHAYDVIPNNKILIVIGDDGLYQYDYSNPKSLKLLSSIKSTPKI